MTIIREWLLGVLAASLLAALAEHLTPEGVVRKIGKLTGGLVVLIAILQPVLKLDAPTLSLTLSQYRDDLGNYEAQVDTENFYLMKDIIEQRTGAYIQDKAAQLGIECTAQVTCRAESTQDYPYPASVTVVGDLTGDQREKLSLLIESELAIPPEEQQFEKEGGDGP